MSDAGKYRWMTCEEAVEELEDDECVWLSTFYGVMPGIYDEQERILKMPYWTLDLSYPVDHWRICRAMVPEAPEVK